MYVITLSRTYCVVDSFLFLCFFISAISFQLDTQSLMTKYYCSISQLCLLYIHKTIGITNINCYDIITACPLHRWSILVIYGFPDEQDSRAEIFTESSYFACQKWMGWRYWIHNIIYRWRLLIFWYLNLCHMTAFYSNEKLNCVFIEFSSL